MPTTLWCRATLCAAPLPSTACGTHGKLTPCSLPFPARPAQKQLAAAANSLDLIIVTVSASLDWQPFVDMLRPRGTICFVGAITKPMELPLFGPLIMKDLKVAGSCIGGRGRLQEMLQVRRPVGAQGAGQQLTCRSRSSLRTTAWPRSWR